MMRERHHPSSQINCTVDRGGRVIAWGQHPAARERRYLLTERADFDVLEADWNALFERAGKPTQVFQTFNWNWHWANHYLASSPGGVEGVKLSLATARRNGRLIMRWSLVAEGHAASRNCSGWAIPSASTAI
jgi:hypothetical protein